MNETLRQYMDSLFADAPQTAKMVELKEEMLQNLTDKYNDLLTEGKSEEAAYNIAVASIGDVRSLIDRTVGQKTASDAYMRAKNRSAILIAVAVCLYIISIVPVLLMQDIMGVVLMFVIAAIATGLLIYNRASKPNDTSDPDTMVDDFKAWKQDKHDRNRAKSSITGAIWLLAVCLYFIISFLTNSWHMSWLIFVLGAAASLIVSGIFDLKE